MKKSIKKTQSLRQLKDEERRGSNRSDLPAPLLGDRQVGSNKGDMLLPGIVNERRGSNRRDSLAPPSGVNNERRGSSSSRRESLALPHGISGERRGSNRAAEQPSAAEGHRGSIASSTRQSRFDMKKVKKYIFVGYYCFN